MLRLSARAQAVLDLAHELARREPGFEPHSGHLLVALVRAGGTLIDDTFLRLTLDYEDVLAPVEKAGSTADAKRELGDALARRAASRRRTTKPTSPRGRSRAGWSLRRRASPAGRSRRSA